jgi:hypothetical protein
MSDVNTEVATEEMAPVTDAVESEVSTQTETPSVEVKDGKMFIDGVRVYTRDETNKIAANAKAQAESKVLQDLDVDSFDQVKSVISELRTVDSNEEQSTLDVQSLRDAVKKREASLEDLKSQVTKLQTELVLKDHMGNLQNAMPAGWSADQRAAVVDLMKARGMMQIQDQTFVIKSGDEFLTTDGETPDYKGAVELVGKTLGLPFAKKGIDSINTDKSPADSSADSKLVDEGRLKSDNAYRTAWVKYRTNNPSLLASQITHKNVMDTIKASKQV